MTPDPELLTDAEAGKLIRKSSATVKRLRLSGVLPYLPGRPVLMRRQDVDAYLRDALVTAPPPRRHIRLHRSRKGH